MKKRIARHPMYAVSDGGVVYRIICQGCYSMLMPDFSNGHPRVDLDGKKESIARLVLEAFDPTDNPYLKAFHIDGDKANNRLDNLVWLTTSEVQRYSTYTVERRKEIFRGRG